MKKHILDIPECNQVGIYAIHNKRTEKYYIGSSLQLLNRLKLHRRLIENLKAQNKKIQSDLLRNEDISDFELLVLEDFGTDEITEIELRNKEDVYIQKYNSVRSGYNDFRHIPHVLGRSENRLTLTATPKSGENPQVKYMRTHQKRVSLNWENDDWYRNVYPRIVKSGLPAGTFIKKAVLNEFEREGL